MEQRYQRTQEKIQYIQDNGYPVKQMWECDWELEVPDHLKGKFAEMPPVFKNTHVSRDDTKDHTKTYAEERGIMNQHGLKVTKIHQVVEYTPATCFQKFGDNISDARRAGDIDPNKKILAETKKLEGNSSYGRTVTNKECHTNGLYCQEHQVSRHLVDSSLLSKKSGSSTNRGFRSMDNQVFIYFQERTGFSYFYPKRKVLADGISIAPLEI
jgi:hypothetical protein